MRVGVIIVREAWDEATSSSTYDWGSFNNQSLHYEGRAAEIAISTNLSLTPNEFLSPPSDDSLLGRLSYIAATCAGFDHVWFKDNHTLQARRLLRMHGLNFVYSSLRIIGGRKKIDRTGYDCSFFKLLRISLRFSTVVYA